MQPKILLSAGIYFFYLCVFSQNNIDELKKKLTNSLDDSARVVTLLDIAFFYIYKNTDSSLFYSNKAFLLAKKTGNILEQANAINMEAIAYQSLGDYAAAISNSNKALTILMSATNTKIDKDIINYRLLVFYNTLGNAYYYLSDFANAIKYYLKAAKIGETLNKNDLLTIMYSNIGSTYKDWGDFDMSIKYLKKALKLAEELNDNDSKLSTLANIGGTYFDNGYFDSAYFYYSKILPEIKNSDDPNMQISVYLNMGKILIEFYNLDKAYEYLKKAKTLINKNDYIRNNIYYYTAMAYFYNRKGELDKAIHYGLSAYKISDSLKEKRNTELILEKLCNLYAQKGDYKSAYEYSVLQQQLKDSIFSEENAKTIRELEVRFDVEKKSLQIEKLKAKQEADRKLKMALWAGILFFMLLTVLLFYSFTEKRKRIELEKELLKAEKDKNDEKIKFQNKQLASQALTMMQKNKMLQDIEKQLIELRKEKPENFSKQLNKIKFQIKRSINSEKDWEVFRLYFEQVNKTFFKKLKELNPALTDHDLRMAALIKLKLNIKEAASLLNLSPHSVKGSRYRLRKKLGLSPQDDLSEFIGKID